MKKIVSLIILLFTLNNLWGEKNINISGLDPSRLLAQQQIELFAVVTDDEGKFWTEGKKEDFIILEDDGTGLFMPRSIVAFEASHARNEPVNFFLMIDNSGSMYTDSEGYRTDDVAQMRMTRAGKAISAFLDSFEGSSDRIGLASFNTNFNPFSFPGDPLSRVRESLALIVRPDNDQAYTELYASLDLSTRLLGRYRGRTIIVVLSDGENYSWFTETGEPHPVWGEALIDPEQLIQTMKASGITLYSINISEEQDAELNNLAIETGGLVFNAYSGEDLSEVYSRIRQRVDNEYRIIYRAEVASENEPQVKIGLTDGNASSPRYYFASPLFGKSGNVNFFIPVLSFMGSIAFFILIRFIGMKKIKDQASLEVLSRPGVKGTTMIIDQNQTIIGSSQNDDLTLAQTVIPQEQRTEIIKDDQTGEFTLVSSATVFVNNNPVKEKRKLEDGDLIRVGEALIVFDSNKQ